MQTQIITRDDVMAAIAALPADKLAEVYDFARFIAERPAVVSEVEPTEAELEAEDAKWDATFSRHDGKFDALAAEAMADIEAGRVLPMFDDNGRWLVDDYTDEDFDKAAANKAAAKQH